MGRAGQIAVKTSWTLAAAICLLTTENLWIDPLLQRKSHHRLPSFSPQAPTVAWCLILLALAIAVILLLVCQVLLMREATVGRRSKLLTAIFAALAAILSGKWFLATSGTLETRTGTPQKRSVVLRWQASTTPGVKYNVYRGPHWGVHPDKLTGAPIEQTTFTDTTVGSGATYWYIVRAVNPAGEESPESNEASATIP
ncbi:MAG TPA: fibronectin type III domain-containing protein, partial [Candidatus Acidoferrum sp.]|nr:fibronectin type III domain-containing protein [Candidatus Acidoferrum sp.]